MFYSTRNLFFPLWIFFHEYFTISRFTRSTTSTRFTVYFRGLTSAHSQQLNSNREPSASERKWLATKVRALNDKSMNQDLNNLSWTHFEQKVNQKVMESSLALYKQSDIRSELLQYLYALPYIVRSMRTETQPKMIAIWNLVQMFFDIYVE